MRREDEKRQAMLDALRAEIEAGVDQLRQGKGRPSNDVLAELMADLPQGTAG